MIGPGTDESTAPETGTAEITTSKPDRATHTCSSSALVILVMMLTYMMLQQPS